LSSVMAYFSSFPLSSATSGATMSWGLIRSAAGFAVWLWGGVRRSRRRLPDRFCGWKAKHRDFQAPYLRGALSSHRQTNSIRGLRLAAREEDGECAALLSRSGAQREAMRQALGGLTGSADKAAGERIPQLSTELEAPCGALQFASFPRPWL